MKKGFALPAIFLLLTLSKTGYSAITAEYPTNSNTDPSWKYLKAAEFVKLDVKEFAVICGKKLKLTEKIAFSIMKMKVKRDLKKKPELLMSHYFEKENVKTTTLWFFLAFLGPLALILLLHLITGLNNSLLLFIPLSLSPVALAYLTKQGPAEKKAAWIGLGALAVLVGLIIVINNNLF